MDDRNWDNVDQTTVTMLSTLEKHAFCKLTELIDRERFKEACQVVHVMERVGLI